MIRNLSIRHEAKFGLLVNYFNKGFIDQLLSMLSMCGAFGCLSSSSSHLSKSLLS